MKPHHAFRDRLLSAESISSADRRGHIEQEIRQMVTKQLSAPKKLAMGIVLIGSLAGAATSGYLALTEQNLPPLARIGLATGTLFGLAWAVSVGTILKKGTIDLKRDARRTAQMVWGFTVLMMVFFLVAGMSAADGVRGLMMIAQALAFLIMAGVYWVSHRIEEAELNVKEQMLRLELQLAELANKP
ncbi:MAG: hypothetical protein NT069_12950 [Planctomycetota bacterium]|nr:hypothetical protein [Planctomycetota bacterium]